MVRLGVKAGPFYATTRGRRRGQFPVVGAFWAILVTIAAVVVWPWLLLVVAGVVVLAVVMARARR